MPSRSAGTARFATNRSRLKRGCPEPHDGQNGEMVGAIGFEPTTPCSRSRCATRLRYAPILTIVGAFCSRTAHCRPDLPEYRSLVGNHITAAHPEGNFRKTQPPKSTRLSPPGTPTPGPLYYPYARPLLHHAAAPDSLPDTLLSPLILTRSLTSCFHSRRPAS